VINLDDAYGEKLAAAVPRDIRQVTFGENPAALVRAENVALGFKNTTFRLVWPQGELAVDSPLIGRYNVSNLLAAIATAWALGRAPAAFLARLNAFPGVAGRMERIEEGQPYNVLVDYAHTDDALRNALGMLRAITPGRLFVVFGCGGNRDRSKRSLMVKAVQEFADFAFATADNPRSEPLAQIFSDMRAGVTAPAKIAWVDDRRRAISLALDGARAGDCLLRRGQGTRKLPGICRHRDPVRRPPGRARVDRDKNAEAGMKTGSNRSTSALRATPPARGESAAALHGSPH